MPIDNQRTRKYLKEFDFSNLFYEELGWDQYSNSLQVSVDSQTFPLTAIAEKRGMAAFLCSPMDDGRIPDYSTRRKIENGVARSVHEHIIIYTDSGRATQIWQWVRRETGRPTACREHAYHKDQPGESLIQKLQGIAFSLEEEENLTLVEVAGRTRAAFDLDRVTKRFYDRFKKEHDAFLKFIEGIPDEELLRWYALVMLNRLMFVYFIQKKGFLSDDSDYLRHKLAEGRAQGADRFYRQLLCPLFFEGFAKKEEERSPEITRMLGKVPYLNGGIFLKHQIEESYGEEVSIPDTAFETLFDFFDQYQWHLDERPLKADNEINPDVLGYIFEKYINQKQMGAYYTKEDITEYIGKNTIIAFLFDRAKEKCKIAFEGAASVWKLLQADPDRYIYEAVKKGADLPFLEDIAQGLDDVSKRTGWNKPAPEEYALPTEIWREVVARRKRYKEVRVKAVDGEITSINDFITYNLNIRQFAQDVIENCEGPELLRAFWHAIVGKVPEKSNERFENGITILDPTCGSGAFLFAALNILEPLYEACLDRMEIFLEELERSGEKHRSDKYGDFRKILKRIEEHPNRRYFILKSIIINNLFGVDIMEEAVEICKLRLFLKLVAQVDEVDKIEPLPDIDFNICAGNTLVGFATYTEVERYVTSKLGTAKTMDSIKEQCQDAEGYFELFRQMQIVQGMDSIDFADAKREAHKRLKLLEDELNSYFAGEYCIDTSRHAAYAEWLKSHQPFHWFIEFYGIMRDGGFGVVIGNPPYVENNKVKDQYKIKGYRTESCGNLYAYVIERCFDIVHLGGRMGMIVQLPIVCTDRMKPLQKECLTQSGALWLASFDDRPARLFEGLEHIRATIFTSCKGGPREFDVYSTNYNRWHSEARPILFDLMQFENIKTPLVDGSFPKIGNMLSKSVLNRIFSFPVLANGLISRTPYVVHFHNSPQYWIRAMDFAPYFWNERDGEQASTQVKALHLATKLDSMVAVAILNSSLFYWWFVILSDCRHLNMREIERFPVGLERMSTPIKAGLSAASEMLMIDLKEHAYRKECQYKTTGKVVYDEFYPRHSKSMIDEIDRILARHYGFTDEELDFIINYDIKYRMGLATGNYTDD